MKNILLQVVNLIDFYLDIIEIFMIKLNRKLL